MDINAFDLQEIKSWTVFLCFDIFFIYSLILAADIVIYLFVIIINGNLLILVAVTMKTVHNATLKKSSFIVTFALHYIKHK